MTPLVVPPSTSVPQYTAPTPCPGAVHHLIVAPSRDAADALSAQLPGAQVLYGSATALAEALALHLQRCQVGAHLYLLGTEAFIWPLHGVACAAGLGHDEISCHALPDSPRRLYCVHCGTLQEAPAAARLTCQQCAVQLAVREHFSPRLGAYLAVCDDADQPYAGARP